ncbi:MAG TPA: ABC transporter permease [Gemmatimonadaceae bacterium]|nr:ABC transporter permease [Gemmatimonadaceae bacterium]
MRAFLNRLRDRLNRRALSEDLRREIAFHESMLERDAIADGAAPDAARAAARQRFGSATAHHEEARDMWSLGLFDDLMQDIRYAARALRRAPGFTTAIVLTLALGIGANTALFSVVNAVLLKPLPYADPERLVSVWMSSVGSPKDRNPTSFPDLTDWRAMNPSFTDIGGYAFNRYEVSGPEGNEFARAIVGTPPVYTVLGATPVLGRLPAPDDAQRAVVTISYRIWRQRYGGARDVIGRSVKIGDESYSIIGVMPAGFHFPTPDIDLWLPIYGIGQSAGNPWLTSRYLHGYRVVARLKPGVDVARAEREMNDVQKRLGETNPVDAGYLIHIQRVSDDALGGVRRPLWLLLGAAGMVLLLACVNVAHLLLARVTSRAREIALRRALGAGRPRITRQLLTESLLLAFIGGAAGVGVAAIATRVLIGLSPADIPRLENVSLNGTVLVFALATSALTGLIFGVVPAVMAWDSGLQSTLREEGRGVAGARRRGRVRAVLTAAEVAFALMLLVGAGLMVKSFVRLLGVDTGFRTDGVAAFHVNFSRQRYPTPADQNAAVEKILAALRALPGITTAGASTSLPPIRMQQATGFSIEGDPAPERGREPNAIFIPATPGYLEALSIGMRGDAFDATNVATSEPVVIVNRELATRYFGDRDPVGRRMVVDGVLRRVTGVAANAPYDGIGSAARPTVYVPFSQSPFSGVWITVRGAGDPHALLPAIRAAVQGADSQIIPRDIKTMDELVGDSLVRPRFQTWLLGIFGALALVLAAVGIYGVVAYGVSQRTAEIGMRLALGAQKRSVIGLVVGRGMVPVAIGLAAGVGGALLMSRLMAGLLFSVRPNDAATFAAVTVLLAVVAALASYLPALRAANVDPIVALRSD